MQGNNVILSRQATLTTQKITESAAEKFYVSKRIARCIWQRGLQSLESGSMLTTKLTPAINAKWPPGPRTGRIQVSVQQDNARPHIAPNNPTWMDAAAASGINLELVCQLPNSLDRPMNVLDLGYFRAIQSQSAPQTTDELIAAIETAFSQLTREKLNNKDFLDVDRVKQEQKVKVSPEEDEVLTERFVNQAEKSVIRERTGNDSEENKLTQCDSNRPDCSDVRDVSRNFTMDVIKVELEVNPLPLERSDVTAEEEKKPILEERNLGDHHVTYIKEEYEDHRQDLKTEIKFEEDPVPFSFPVVKREPEEWNLWDQHVTDIKEDYEDQSQDHTTEINLEEGPVPISFPLLKHEPENEFYGVVSYGALHCADKSPGHVQVFLALCGIADRGCPEDTCAVILIASRHSLEEVHSDFNEQPRVDVTPDDNEVLAEVCECLNHPASYHNCLMSGFHKNERTASTELASLPLEENEIPRKSGSSEKSVHTREDEKQLELQLSKIYSSPAKNLNSRSSMDVRKKPSKSEVCDESLSNSKSLKTHESPLTGENRFKCDVCGSCFSESSCLKRHERVHSGQKPFKCDVCGNCFSRPSLLKCHERVHSGEKPFKCDICGKSFSRLGNLKSHVRVHSGERPFKCDVCGKCFLETGALTRHVRVHTGERPFKCDVCGVLKAHLRMHIGEKPLE
ncbi:hypothetical protein ANN_27479 [Periplaneta americana]|uniref:C2H2-type domain-containing protein n=1 Tax=Periplaneta americana TaxID=6978 RepID=A0ABQ8RW14_PERAM|nr:hypothetical protein ANN_27479 [Periplaneta americana]